MTSAFGPPTITPAKFEAVLRAKRSPALDERPAGDYYAAIVSHGIDPAFMLAVYGHESSFGTNPHAVVNRYGTKNWGNTRSLVAKVFGTVIQTDRGPFVRFRSWLDSLHDACARLYAPHKPYAKAGARTVETIIPIWAPKKDMDNDPASYTNAVLRMMRDWRDVGEGVRKVVRRIALAAGHHNTDGGNRYEYDTVGRLTPAIARECRRLGMDVRIVQGEDDPSRDYPGGIWDVARQVCKWAEAGWVPDIFLETHTQGVGDTSVNGVFAIYPDWGSDLDTDARDKLGPLAVRKVAQATGLRVWSNGLMSEKRTGVGLSGYRLGILNKTEPLKATTTRLLIEYGAHSNPEDARKHRTDAFFAGAARATAEAFAEFLGVTPVVEKFAPAPNPLYVPTTGHYISPNLYDFYVAGGGVASYGYPLEGSRTDADGVERQLYENVELEYYPDTKVVRLGGLGQRYKALKGAA